MCEFLSFKLNAKGDIFVGNLFSHSEIECPVGLLGDVTVECEWTGETPEYLSIRVGETDQHNENWYKATLLAKYPTRSALMAGGEVANAITNLTRLDLGGARITELPPEIGKLANLTRLYLDNTGITVLPPEIGKLTNLTTLYLDNTGITVLPPEIGKLTNLTTLYLSGTGITELPPEIGKLTNLTTLYLSGTGITELPPEIGKLTNLTTLYLGGAGIVSLAGWVNHGSMWIREEYK